MLYEDIGGSGGGSGWESLPGFEEGTVVLPGVHNPGGLLQTGSAGGSESEATRSEVGGLETLHCRPECCHSFDAVWNVWKGTVTQCGGCAGA
eukprot:1136213-Pelagomonas_calceolata.AAC.3